MPNFSPPPEQLFPLRAILSLLKQLRDSPQREQFMATPVPKDIAFLIDNNTTIDGKMTVGATASVIYREDNGNNLAVNVIVDN